MALPAGALLPLFLACAGAAPLPAGVPTAYSTVLDRHGLDLDGLGAAGYVFVDGLCMALVADGVPGGPALSPEELDAALSRLAAVRPPEGEPTLERRMAGVPAAIRLPAAEAIETPGIVFDGLRPGGRGAAQSNAPGSSPEGTGLEDEPAAKPPLTEPEFDESWKPVGRDLYSRARFKRGLKAAAARFVSDPESETGLGPDAPEALRMISLAVHDGKGGSSARAELRRELAIVANLKPDQKTAFAALLRSPRTAYVALGLTQTPHAADARLYFGRMEALLAESGRSVTDYIREDDPEGRRAASFLLRAHAYDALVPYLHRHPAEAGAVVPLLFPDGRDGEIRAKAAQLEGLMTQLAAQARFSGALDAFVKALAARRAEVAEPTARRIAVFLKINQKLLPRRYGPAIEEAAKTLPPDLLEDAGLLPDTPYESWPAEKWSFALHFASTDSFHSWVRAFVRRGYSFENTPDGPVLSQAFGGTTVSLLARLYQGDAEGFLHGAEAKRFTESAARDLRDPAIQGVILRSHAQFRIVKLFGRGVNPRKLLIDGACRSAWDLSQLRRRCPTCYFVVNTGSGYGSINNEAVTAVVEGLAGRKEWDEIGRDWAAQSPRSSARMQGPWTPAYAEALGVLEQSERSSPKVRPSS